MSRTRNLQLIGAAAHAQKLDDMREINYQIDRQAVELKAKTLDTCDRIASILTPTQYAEWWETTPDNNAEFYAAACTKLDELIETAKRIMDETMANPTATAIDQSGAIDQWMTLAWETMPEIEL